MNKFRKILLALALVFGGLAAVAPASPVSAGPYDGYASYTDCLAPASSFSTYVCFDETTVYGPVIYIRYANGSFSTQGVAYAGGNAACRSFAQTPAMFVAGSGSVAFEFTGTWPNFQPNTGVCPNIGTGQSPAADNLCYGGGWGLIGICSSSMFNSLRTVANNSSFWFVWAD